ncbi:hypothetical protein MNEG_8623 [Monoraphidium neglectum]|uniref:Protein kinase domain-containing protein n=1 Tax=Monoraphidium neglectum TaxID=145388 RepID=A0A0D2JJ53_9CHLO|nr:hypothetical protein MNEG_8623 [Monoraphidium neglectum]KIY99337.1 hypothetical protein MNEG_8623 [Monoraphidium neglectum]|eukprot:XP_013898357.1 hypothetical protein MNEG_8623 [Monoraphidium neglectum]
MFTAVTGKHTTFSCQLEDDSALGVPDFWFGGARAGSALLLGEGKTPLMLGACLSLHEAVRDEEIASSCAEEICDYMRKRGMTYGFLTCLNSTYFIRRTGRDRYEFTDAIRPFDTGPTVLEMLMYVLMKQEEAGPWPSATEGGEQQAVPAGATSAAAAAASRNQRYPLCSRIADASGASGGQKAGSSEQEHAASALELTGKRLGWGKCGGVNVGWFHGQPAAIKAIDLSKQGSLLPALQAEVAIYDRLKPLQGVCIPVLYGCGFWNYRNTYFVATSIVAGKQPGRSTREGRQAAEQALRQIHARGVLHGDIRRPNIFVAVVDGRWEAWIIDFDFATASSDADAQAAELAELLALFGPS